MKGKFVVIFCSLHLRELCYNSTPKGKILEYLNPCKKDDKEISFTASKHLLGGVICYNSIIPYIYSVIGFFIRQYLNSYPKDLKMKEWVISRYSENPDSPFTQDEIMSWRHDTQ